MNTMLNIVLFGPPGAGKGTQAEKLTEKFGLVHLSTGDIFRKHKEHGTELGLLAKNYMDKGALVPDEVTIRMLEQELDKQPLANGFIFDGFPRTTLQAQALDSFLHQRGSAITMTLALEVDEEELTKRILLRGKNSGRADDQDESIVRKRVSEYNTKTAPLKHFYKGQNKLHVIEGVGAIEDIFRNLCLAVEKVMAEKEVHTDLHKVFGEAGKNEPAEVKKAVSRKVVSRRKPVRAKLRSGRPGKKSRKAGSRRPAKKRKKR